MQSSDDAIRARDRALRLLTVRSRSVSELRGRLFRAGFTPEIVDPLIAELLERRYLDDAQFSEAFARERMRNRPRGGRRILQELRTKGIDDRIAAEALERALVDEQVTEADLARRAAEAWRKRQRVDLATPDGRDRARKRLWGYLARRGFSGAAIRLAVNETLRGA